MQKFLHEGVRLGICQNFIKVSKKKVFSTNFFWRLLTSYKNVLISSFLFFFIIQIVITYTCSAQLFYTLFHSLPDIKYMYIKLPLIKCSCKKCVFTLRPYISNMLRIFPPHMVCKRGSMTFHKISTLINIPRKKSHQTKFKASKFLFKIFLQKPKVGKA